MRKIAMLLAAPMVLTSLSASAQEVQWTNWTRMNPNSYRVSVAEMTNRCLAGAAVSTVTPAECEEVTAMIQGGSCAFAPVPDGIRYEFMNGLRAGQPHVYPNMIKSLGSARTAYVCRTSNGRVFDWYVGENGISCGNLGAREFVPVASLIITLPPAPPQRTTGIVISSTILGGQPSVAAPGVLLTTPGASYSGGSTNINVGSRARSSSTSSSGNGGCNTCAPHADH